MEEWQFWMVILCIAVAFVAGLLAATEATSEFDVLDRYCTHENPNLQYEAASGNLQITDSGELSITCVSNGAAEMKQATFKLDTESGLNSPTEDDNDGD